jgi:hypothetical protein
MPSIARTLVENKNLGELRLGQRPSAWRVSSAGTLEGVGCDGRSAVHRGSPGRRSLPPSPLRRVPREDVRLAVHNAGSAQGPRAGRATRRGAPASSPARGRAAHPRLTDTTPHPGERRSTRGASSRAGRRDPGSPAGPGASAKRPMSTALARRSGEGLGGRACAALGLQTHEPPSNCRPRRERFYRHGGRGVGGRRAPAPRLDPVRST